MAFEFSLEKLRKLLTSQQTLNFNLAEAAEKILGMEKRQPAAQGDREQ
jgi:hypothetical protein